MSKPFMICCFVLLTLFGGCASAPKERIPIVPGGKAGLRPPAMLTDAIDRKIARLETLLNEKRLSPEDEPLAVVVIRAYQSAKSCLEERLSRPCDGVNEDLLQGLSLIDERYFSRAGNTLAPRATLAPVVPATPSGAEGSEPREGVQNRPPNSAAVPEPAKDGRIDDAGGMPKEKLESLQDAVKPQTNEQPTDSVRQEEELHLRERIDVIAMKEQTLSHARQLVEAEKFEEAIAAIDSLGVGESVDVTARTLLDEAVSGIVNRERNRAAKAFYSAKQTDDPARKEAYLRSSYDILTQLLDKYPSSSLTKKIKLNLDTVKSEMVKIGLTP
jgi:hypothetical protein